MLALKSHFRDAQKAVSDLIKFPQDATDSEIAKLKWIVRLRWIACTFFLFLSPTAYHIGLLDRTSILIFIGALSLLALFNLFTQLLLLAKSPSNGHGVHSINPSVVGLQLTLDLIAISSLLLISRSLQNPLTPLFFVNVALGAVLIRGQYAWPYWILSHTLFASLQTHHAITSLPVKSAGSTGEPSIAIILAPHVLIASVWLVMRSLSTYLESQSESLMRSRMFAERQDRLRAIGALAAGFSHEFASPLNAAKLRLGRLHRSLNHSSNVDSVWIEDIEAAEHSIAACEKVIREMNASQFDVGSHEKKSIPLVEFLNDIADAWREEHPDAKLSLLTDQIDASARADVPIVSFAQVLINLLDNAHEAAPGGHIRLSLEKRDSWIQLAVEDDGTGFSPAVLSQRGEPFLTTKPHGTGLGLYVSEIFVQSLGGHLNIENCKPSGARVSLAWPTPTTEVST